MATYISNLMGDEIWDIKKEQVDNYEMQRKKKSLERLSILLWSTLLFKDTPSESRQ